MEKRNTRVRAFAVLGLAGAVMAVALLSPVTAADLTKPKAKKIAAKQVKKLAVLDGEIDAAAVSSGAITNVTSATPVDVAGASVAVTNGGSGNALLTATFSGSSSCGGGGPADACILVALVDGAVMQPSENAGGFYIFDSEGTSGNDVNESHAVTFHANVGPGSHTVKIQAYGSGGVTLQFRGWSLVAEVHPA